MEQTAEESPESMDVESIDDLATKGDSNMDNKTEHGKISYLKAAKESKSDGKNAAESNDPKYGAVAFIYYIDPETGVREDLVEQNKPNYPKGEGGRLRLIGGVIEDKEESIDALVRELGEEFNPVAVPILIKALYGDGEYHSTREDGTVVYKIPIKSKGEWRIIKESGSKKLGSEDDPGNFRAIRGDKALNLDNRYYAFESGDFIKEEIRRSYDYARKNQNNYRLAA